MSHNLNNAVAVIGIDIRKNSFHVVGLDSRGAIVLRQKWSGGIDATRVRSLPYPSQWRSLSATSFMASLGSSAATTYTTGSAFPLVDGGVTLTRRPYCIAALCHMGPKIGCLPQSVTHQSAT